jgi:hypothetical protein
MAVTPGSAASPDDVDVNVALHDGHVSRSAEGRDAEHHGQWNVAKAASVVSSSAMAGMLPRVLPVGIPQLGYSHSIVAGGFDEMSYTTRLTPGTSLTIRDEIFARTSYGSFAQSAVMPSSEVTARTATTFA